jgi:hypothetical protein
MAFYADDGNNVFPCTAPPAADNTFVTAFSPNPSGFTSADSLLNQLPMLKAGSPVACLWILTLQNQAPPKMFLCKSDGSVATAARREAANGEVYSNFQDQYQISYSIAYPWRGGGIAPYWRNHLLSSEPLLSDMAPLSGDNNKDPAGAPRGSHRANSANHDDQGQNVSYGDIHVEFQKTPYALDSHENIFTVGPVSAQVAITAPGVVPPTQNLNDFVMVPVRKTSDGSIGP